MKGCIVFLYIVVIFFLGNSSAAPSRHIYRTDIEKILDTVPEKERLNFLKYHVNLGYELAQKQSEWPDTVTSELAMKLYAYASENLSIEDRGKLQQAQNIICFEDGTCIDLGDIGVHP